MGHTNPVILRFEVAGNFINDENRAVMAAGAADGDG
jgi:hypothetical protein